MANEIKLAAQLNGRCVHFGDFSDKELLDAGLKTEELSAKYLGYELVNETTIRMKYYCNYCKEEEIVEKPVEEDFLYIGDCPYDEDPYKQYSSRKAAQAFALQLKNTFGNPPDGAHIRVAREEGGGGYYTVVCDYTTGKPLSVAYAFMLEGNLPAKWSPAALTFLQSNN